MLTTRRIRTILTASLIGAATSLSLLGQPGPAGAAPNEIEQQAPRAAVAEGDVQAPRTPDAQEAPRTPDAQEAPRGQASPGRPVMPAPRAASADVTNQ